MTLSNETYWINISKVNYPLRYMEAQAYDHVFNPCEYTEDDFHSAFIIKIKNVHSERYIALIGSFYADEEHCAALDGTSLTVLMDDEIVNFNLEILSISKQKSVGNETYFSIYSINGGYIIHGELSILRLDKNHERLWDFSGSDIWVTQDRTHEAFKILDDQIFLEDWNGVQYAIDMDGKLIWDTFNE
ncbi:MAG: hypothetical protein ACOX7O_05860 [Oscillospiraceae bacterium]|jgi:outer membrane protein assembly factor BamB